MVNREAIIAAGECFECGGQRELWTRGDYCWDHWCPDCGCEGTEFDEDLYGCMAVPWGFLL